MTQQIEYTDTDGSFLYRFFDAEGQLLYIGIATEPKSRWRSHYATEWWPKVARKTLEWHDSRKAAEEAEATAIRDEHPRYNKLHNKQNGLAMTKARARFPHLVDRAIRLQETTYITQYGRRVAALVPFCAECGELMCCHHASHPNEK